MSIDMARKTYMYLAAWIKNHILTIDTQLQEYVPEND